MKNLLKLLTLFLIFIVLAGCGLIESKSETNQSTAEIFGGTPVSWLYYKDNKYVFNRVIPNDEIDMTLIEPTNIKTKMGDGNITPATLIGKNKAIGFYTIFRLSIIWSAGAC